MPAVGCICSVIRAENAGRGTQLLLDSERLAALVKRNEPRRLEPYLISVVKPEVLVGTKTSVHCYGLRLDGNKQPLATAFAHYLADRLIDFAIPRSELEKAHNEFATTGSSELWARLQHRARNLFSSAEVTGEAGELLLFCLVEAVLQAPQVLCKLSLKTNANMHVHGIDGLHVRFDKERQELSLFWGESKMKGEFSAAVKSGLSDLHPFLCGDPTKARERDLQLVRDNVDLLDDELEDALVEYLDPDSSRAASTIHRGTCLIGFDATNYPTTANTHELDAVVASVAKSFGRWRKAVHTRISELDALDSAIVDVFLVPLPSTDQFRQAFLERLGLGAA